MRLQILPLPAPADEYPFVLVFDQLTEAEVRDLTARDVKGAAAKAGARSAMLFTQTVEIV